MYMQNTIDFVHIVFIIHFILLKACKYISNLYEKKKLDKHTIKIWKSSVFVQFICTTNNVEVEFLVYNDALKLRIYLGSHKKIFFFTGPAT